jgi:hypothetical protein
MALLDPAGDGPPPERLRERADDRRLVLVRVNDEHVAVAKRVDHVLAQIVRPSWL